MEQRAGTALVTHEDRAEDGGETRVPGVFTTLDINFNNFPARVESINTSQWCHALRLPPATPQEEEEECALVPPEVQDSLQSDPFEFFGL